jgi:biopolymer transport protein ExbD
MLKRPSSRRKSRPEEVNINLVPMLDALVTLVAFLLFSMAFVSIAVIDTPAPLLAPADEQQEKLKEQPLQLTAHVQENQIVLTDWAGSRVNKTIPSVQDPADPEKTRYDLESLHKALLEIKEKFPKETKLILKPNAGVAYEAIVGIIDASRAYEKTDTVTPPTVKNERGEDVPDMRLFPEIIFGNIMS